MDSRARTESFESIPDVDFMVQSIEADLASFDISDFRVKEAAGELLPEPLLIPDNSRFVLFPIKHSDVSVSATQGITASYSLSPCILN